MLLVPSWVLVRHYSSVIYFSREKADSLKTCPGRMALEASEMLAEIVAVHGVP